MALAADFGGEHRFIVQQGPAPLRYLRAASETWRSLNTARPRTVVVITPPVFAPLVTWWWCRRNRAKFIVDCHTGSFSGRWAWARAIHRLLLRRADAVLLHNEPSLALVESWGAPGLLFPDDVPDPAQASNEPTSGAEVLVAGSLDENEPVAAELDAARLLPEVRFAFTGDPARLSSEQRQELPPNVTLTGYLDYPRFLAEVRAARVVAVWSTERDIMNRAAFEVVGMGRALVLSDFPGLRERFGAAAKFSSADPDRMAGAVGDALSHDGELAERSRRLAAELRSQRHAAASKLAEMLLRDRRSRALLVSQHPFPQHTAMRRNVSALLARGIAVDLVYLGPSASSERPGLSLHRVPVTHRRGHAFRYLYEYGVFFLCSTLIAWRLSLRHRYDVVQIDNPPDSLIVAGAIARFRGARIVLNMFELFPEMLAGRLNASSDSSPVRVARWWERRAVRWADAVLTVSRTCERIVVGRGADPGKMTIVPNSVTVSASDSMPSDGLQRPYVITHATLIERYGVQVAIRAMLHLKGDWPDLQLRVLGDGEYRGQLEHLTRELHLEDVIVFTGFLPWADSMAQVSRALVGIVPVIPDGYGELLLPTKLLEYVELGVAVVSARLPAIQEHFSPSSVSYFEPGDERALAAAVDRLLRDRQASAAQAASAARDMGDLRWDRAERRYLSALGLPRRA